MKKDASNLYEVFQRMLEAARVKAGKSQSEVADELGVHQTFVSKVENGDRRLDVIEFLQVAQVLKIDPQDFIRKLNTSLTANRKKRK